MHWAQHYNAHVLISWIVLLVNNFPYTYSSNATTDTYEVPATNVTCPINGCVYDWNKKYGNPSQQEYILTCNYSLWNVTDIPDVNVTIVGVNLSQNALNFLPRNYLKNVKETLESLDLSSNRSNDFIYSIVLPSYRSKLSE